MPREIRAASGLEKPAGRNTGTALQADSTYTNGAATGRVRDPALHRTSHGSYGSPRAIITASTKSGHSRVAYPPGWSRPPLRQAGAPAEQPYRASSPRLVEKVHFFRERP